MTRTLFTLTCAAFLGYASSAMAAGYERRIAEIRLSEPAAALALIWDAESDEYIVREVALQNLIEANRLEGRFFRVVDAMTDEPILLSSGDVEATNVYYHLSRAKDYFDMLGVDWSHARFPITVRVHVRNGYNAFTRFSQEECFNNARTIRGIYDSREDRWTDDPEIWFHESRYRPRRFRHWLAWVIPALKNTPLGAKEVRLATALAPDIIYHELAHIVTAQHLGAGLTTLLAEGFSNYFAASLENDPRIGNLNSSYVPRNAQFNLDRIIRYNESAKIYFRPKRRTWSFVPAFLWHLRKELGGEETDILVLRSLPRLQTTSSIQEMVSALQTECAGTYPEIEAAARCRGLIETLSSQVRLTSSETSTS